MTLRGFTNVYRKQALVDTYNMKNMLLLLPRSILQPNNTLIPEKVKIFSCHNVNIGYVH